MSQLSGFYCTVDGKKPEWCLGCPCLAVLKAKGPKDRVNRRILQSTVFDTRLILASEPECWILMFILYFTILSYIILQ